VRVRSRRPRRGRRRGAAAPSVPQEQAPLYAVCSAHPGWAGARSWWAEQI